jgi:hypothetical protein
MSWGAVCELVKPQLLFALECALVGQRRDLSHLMRQAIFLAAFISKIRKTILFLSLFFIVLLFICAYKAWVISPPCPHPLPYHPLRPLPLPPTPSIPSRNYFALISNFVEERV